MNYKLEFSFNVFENTKKHWLYFKPMLFEECTGISEYIPAAGSHPANKLERSNICNLIIMASSLFVKSKSKKIYTTVYVVYVFYVCQDSIG